MPTSLKYLLFMFTQNNIVFEYLKLNLIICHFILILPLDIHSDKSHSLYDKFYFPIFLKIILSSNYFRENSRSSGCLVINSAKNKVGLFVLLWRSQGGDKNTLFPDCDLSCVSTIQVRLEGLSVGKEYNETILKILNELLGFFSVLNKPF